MNKLVKLAKIAFPKRSGKTVEVLLAGWSTLFENPDRYLKSAAKAIKKAAGEYKCVDLVGHSLGGFTIRAYT